MHLYSLSILYVEGEKSLRESFLYHDLEQTFTTVVLKKNSEEALYELKQEQFDVIIIDFDLPCSNGLSLCKTIKGRKIYTPIILLLDIAERLKITRFPFVDRYLIKPLDTNTLFDGIKSLCMDSFIFDDISYIVKMDLQGNVLYINNNMEKLLKINKKEILGRSYLTLSSYLQFNSLNDVFLNCFDKKISWDGYIFLKNKKYYKAHIKLLSKKIILNNEKKSILEGYSFILFKSIEMLNDIFSENKKLKKEKNLLINHIKSFRVSNKFY